MSHVGLSNKLFPKVILSLLSLFVFDLCFIYPELEYWRMGGGWIGENMAGGYDVLTDVQYGPCKMTESQITSCLARPSPVNKC